MADNIELNAGSGGATLATDDVTSVHYQIIKISTGADGVAGTIVSDSNPLPIDDAGGSITVDGTFWQATQPVSAASLPLPSGAATAANQTTIIGYVDGIETLLGTIDADTSTLAAVDYATSSDVASLAVVGGGVEATALRVTIASDSTGVLSVDDGGGALTVDGTVTANLSATDNAVLDNIDTSTTAAQSMYRNIDANAEAEIKGSAGTLHWLHVMNLTAAKAYVHLYNAAAASVTPGTTTPDLTFPVPTQGDTNGAGFALPLGPTGQRFSTGITLVVTTTIDGSTGDPGTNGVFVNAGYT